MESWASAVKGRSQEILSRSMWRAVNACLYFAHVDCPLSTRVDTAWHSWLQVSRAPACAYAPTCCPDAYRSAPVPLPPNLFTHAQRAATDENTLKYVAVGAAVVGGSAVLIAVNNAVRSLQRQVEENGGRVVVSAAFLAVVILLAKSIIESQ